MVASWFSLLALVSGSAPLVSGSAPRIITRGVVQGAGSAPRQLIRMGAPLQPPATVGFIGLGIMGEGQAANLLKAGFKLVVWNRDARKAAALAAAHPAGAVRVAGSAREVVAATPLTYTMLSTLDASAAVFDGPDGVLAGVGAGSAIVDCATLTPERMGAMAAAVRAKGGAFLEAPVSGSKKPAADGQLVFLCAGDRSALELATAGLEAMGKSTHYYGTEVGVGTRMKLVVNMVMGAQLAAIGEGVALCEAAGLSAAELVEVLKEGAMASPMVAAKGQAMAARAYAPAFPLTHAQKDMGFALDLGAQLGAQLPVAAAANALFEAAKAAGHSDADFSAVVEVSRARARARGAQ